MIADASGNLVAQVRYTAFGEIRSGYSGASVTDYEFTGQLSKIDEIGLLFFKARWLDPAIAHIASADTLVPDPFNGLDWDRFSYVLENPINNTDPTGHMSCELGDCRDGGYHVTKKFMQKVIKNEFNWNTDRGFSLGELQSIFTSGWGIRTYVNGITNGKGKEWMSQNLSSINFHRDGLPHEVVSFLNGIETSLVFLKNDIWLGSGFNKSVDPIQHVIHELGHVFDNSSGKGLIPGIWGGGSYSDRLVKFVGGNPTSIRWSNGSSGIPIEYQWKSSAGNGYGNHSSADYFAEAFSWTIIDASKCPNQSVVNFMNARIVLSLP